MYICLYTDYGTVYTYIYIREATITGLPDQKRFNGRPLIVWNNLYDCNPYNCTHSPA